MFLYTIGGENIMLDNDIEIICDDSKPMEPYPPLTAEEELRADESWQRLESKFLKNMVPFIF